MIPCIKCHQILHLSCVENISDKTLRCPNIECDYLFDISNFSQAKYHKIKKD